MRTVGTHTAISAVLALAILCFAVPVSAHNLGASLEKEIDGRLIDIGYDPIQPTTHRSLLFDFSIRNAATKDLQDFDYVWVRLLKGKETVLATGVYRRSLGPTTLLVSLQEAGDYILDASFQNADGKEIVQAEFPITVERSGESSSANSLLVIVATSVLSLLVGAALGLLLAVGRMKSTRR